MYVGGNKKGEYERKRAQLLDKAREKERNLTAMREAYKNALFNDSNSTQTINLDPNTKTSTGTQTANMTSTTTASADSNSKLFDSASELLERMRMKKEDYDITDIGDEDDSLSMLDDAEAHTTGSVAESASSVESDIDQEVSRNIIIRLYDTYDFLPGKKLRPLSANMKLSNKYYMYKRAGLKDIKSGEDVPLTRWISMTLDWVKTEGYVRQVIADHEKAVAGIRESQNKRLAKSAFDSIKQDAVDRVAEREEKAKARTDELEVKRALENSQVSVDRDSRSRKKIAMGASAKDKIKFLFRENPWLEAAKIRPTGKDRVYHEYVFGENANLNDVNGTRINNRIVGVFYRDKMDWDATLNNILDIIRERVNKKKLSDWEQANALASYNAVIPPSTSKLRVGRGLKGAGITRGKNCAFNLRDIKGTGMASDLKYKALGSKFIRVADLDKGKLKLVYPNRTSVGKIRDISKDLCDILKDLVYDGNINESKFNELDIDDKQLLIEILDVCHLKYQSKNPLKEPREHLKYEYNKLRGMIELGNDNPAIVRELKTLAVDLYEFGLISKTEFKKIAAI